MSSKASVVAGWTVTVAIYIALAIPTGFIAWQFACLVGNAVVALLE